MDVISIDEEDEEDRDSPANRVPAESHPPTADSACST